MGYCVLCGKIIENKNENNLCEYCLNNLDKIENEHIENENKFEIDKKQIEKSNFNRYLFRFFIGIPIIVLFNRYVPFWIQLSFIIGIYIFYRLIKLILKFEKK